MLKLVLIIAFWSLVALAVVWEPLLCPRREDVLCPVCERPARVGKHWRCDCGHTFDTFAHRGRCPSCRLQWRETMCSGCRQWSQHERWYTHTPIELRLEPRAARRLELRPRTNAVRCPFCRGELDAEESVAVCGSCAAPHHAECWIEHSRCASCLAPRQRRAA